MSYCHSASSVRPSGVNFNIFYFSSESAERNSMKIDRKQDLDVLYQVYVFRADRKNKMVALASDWLRHFRLLLWNRWTEFNETWQEARSKHHLPSLSFSRRLEKTLWLSWPLIVWDIFDCSSETAERNSTKLGRKQDLNVLYQVCVFLDDWKNKMAAPAFDWLRHFRILPWREFNETWQKGRSWRPLPSLCSFGLISESRWPPLPLIGWDIFHFSSQTAERSSTTLDRKQHFNILYQTCVLGGWSWKQDGRPCLWSMIGRDIFDFSFETLEQRKLSRWICQWTVPSSCTFLITL